MKKPQRLPVVYISEKIDPLAAQIHQLDTLRMQLILTRNVLRERGVCEEAKEKFRLAKKLAKKCDVPLPPLKHLSQTLIV